MNAKPYVYNEDKNDFKERGQPRSAAVVSGVPSNQLGPKTYVTVRSPFTKGKASELNRQSEDRASVDSVKSENSEWRADKYVPNNHQIKSEVSNRKSRFRLIRVDWKEINSCGTYCRIVTSVFSGFIILLIALNIDSDESNSFDEPIETNNTIDRQKLKPISLLVEDYAKYFLIAVCVMSIAIETSLAIAYSFHVVENFSDWPWLWLESTYATVFALTFLVLSIWMLFYGFWFLIAAFIGIVIALIYLIWAIIKISRYRSGRPAQRGSDDPDGDTLRRLTPNLKFSRSDDELMKDDREVRNKEDILY